jgi:autotransporter-associated beta strand protein
LTVTNAITGLPVGAIASNTFSVRWLGQLLTTNVTGSYTFTTTCDDGSRLWVNGTLLIDNWIDQGAIAKSNSITLTANTRYDIVMEYYQNGGGANAILSWTPPGGTSAPIPSASLFLPGAGAFAKTGGGLLTLSGVNTYTGPTFVGGGTLEISSANGLASPTVTVTNGATLKLDSATALNSQVSLILNTNGSSPVVNLNYTGGSSIGLLSFDGGATFTPGGSWGPIGSGAAHTSSRLTGTGLLNLGVCSATNSIVGITNNGNHTVTLTMQGTSGAEYSIITQTNVAQPMTNWLIVPGSTNLVTAPNGRWSLTISNSAPTSFYRVKASSSCF